MKKKITEVNVKRVNEIEVYLFSLNSMCNPNMRDHYKKNVIGINSALTTLEALREELSTIHIDINNINLKAIYEGVEPLSAEDVFIKSLGWDYRGNRKQYEEILRAEEMEEIFSTEEREARVKEINVEIAKNEKFIQRFSSNKNLCKSKEDNLRSLRAEKGSIELTFVKVDRTSLRDLLFMEANSKLEQIKRHCNYQCEYLGGLL